MGKGPTSPASPPRALRIGSYALAIGAAWTAVLAASLGWNLHQSRRTILSLARAQAEAAFRRDLAYRAWVADKGGVYVPSSAATPPNPHLAHVPERDLVTPSGRRLTLVNSAYMSRQVQEMARENGQEQTHITSLRLLRPEKAPDAWEAAALARLERGETRVESLETLGGEPHLRFMGRLLVEERCLKCHASQGYRVGDIRGGLAVAVPLAPLLAIEWSQDRSLSAGHLAVWLLGLGGLLLTTRRLAARVRERDRAEAALRTSQAEKARLEQQLAQSRKLEALGQLAAGVAHDFNNLLSPILGLSGMAAAELPPENPLREDLQEIRLAAERGRDLTRRLLAFGRKQLLDPDPVYLGEVVADLEPMLRRLIGEHVEMEIATPPVQPVRADRSQLETALVNLVVNARDAMPDRGRLVIATADRQLSPGEAEGLYVPPGPYAEVSVSDTGCGMETETLSHMFEPFFTTKTDGRGSGLGLAMVHGVVKQHGGAIRVTSSPGRGTTFRILLPVSDRAPGAAPRPETSAPRGTETVLLAEDDAGARRFLRAALEGLGYEVLVAQDGTEALRLAREWNRPIHLLLSDVVMPRMSGRELHERLSAERPETRVLFVSGHTRDVFASAKLPAEAGVLQKPFSQEELARSVRAALDLSAPTSA